jgi:hypothetical protein
MQYAHSNLIHVKIVRCREVGKPEVSTAIERAINSSIKSKRRLLDPDTVAALKIQRQWRRSSLNLDYLICQKRLNKEFSELYTCM